MESARLVPLYDGVYAVGHTALTDKSHLVAAVYACGDEALASHRAAGALWGVLRWPQRIEVTAPRGCKPKTGVRVHRSRVIHPEDRALIDNIPVTSLARTLVDLADVLTEERLADAVNEAELRQIFDLKPVERVLARLPGRRGRHKLQRVLSTYNHVQPFTRSRGERLVWATCNQYGVDKPLVNTWVHGYEVDFYWPKAGLVLEFDGGVHRTTRRFYEDRKRDRALAAHGIHVVRATDRDEPAALANELLAILSIRTPR